MEEEISQEKVERENIYQFPVAEIVRVNNLGYKLPLKLREILDGFKWAIHQKRQSAVVVVDGRSGMGKTTLSFQMAKYMTPTFNLDNVHFTPDSFLDALTHTEKGETLVFDEAMLLSSRSALSSINKMIIVAMSMIRSKNLFIIFNVNSVFDLDKNLALSRADLLLHCYGDSLTDKGKFLAFFKGSDGRDRIKDLYINRKKFYSYSEPKANFFSHFSEEFVLNQKEYEDKKQIGVNNFLKGAKTKTKQKYLKQRNIVLKVLKKELGLTYAQLEELVTKHGFRLGMSELSRLPEDYNLDEEPSDTKF